ncbi:MAG: HD domain-containing protein [Oscillospiraceae bacterium]|nr:HD domain-containing protein [Oscillospiraceae bacterium]
MTISEIMRKMIAFSQGNIHDIDHLIRVWAYARTIGELEGLDEHTQFITEAAAITHDIACPLCRVKYGNTNGKYQEREGAVLAADFLQDTGMAQEDIDRVAYLVGHHHTPAGIDGPDYQILIEADYIANAEENSYFAQNIEQFLGCICKTASGEALIREIFSETLQRKE